MNEVETHFKEPKAKRAKGRARAKEDLAAECEIRGCTARAQERHHILRRSAGGSDFRSNTMDICSAHHAYIHANPAESYKQGWLERRSA